MFPSLDLSTTGGQPPLQSRFPQMLRSKRLRAVAAAAVFFVVLLFFFASSEYVEGFRATHFRSSPLSAAQPDQTVDWSRFAYVQYVTNTEYLCNSVMLFERLHTLGTRADKLMMYPAQFTPGDSSQEGRLLVKARDEYGVKLTPIQVQHRDGADGETPHSWSWSSANEIP